MSQKITGRDDIAALVSSLEESHADGLRNGPVSIDEVRRSTDEAIEQGARQRKRAKSDRASAEQGSSPKGIRAGR